MAINKLDVNALPKSYSVKEQRKQKVLRIAVYLAQSFEGRDWQRYPNASQEKFQTKMLMRAERIMKIAEE